MPVPADRQTDSWRDRQAGGPLSGAETPGAQWLPWIHSWSLFAARTLYVFLYARVHACAWVYFGNQEPGH